MKGNKIAFLENHATDPRVASALLSAPAFLRGLSDAEVGFAKMWIEQFVATEIAEARVRHSRLWPGKQFVHPILQKYSPTLTYLLCLPRGAWRRIRTNNPLAPMLPEIRTRVVAVFPDG